jgi:UDP-glucose-4-epimerase GalE
MSAQKSILVTGGAGYVGSHCASYLAQRGFSVVTLDNLSAGHEQAASGELIVGDIRDYDLLCELLGRDVDAVMHFAALMQVDESSRQPLEYFDTNVNGTLCLLRAMQATGVQRLVVSSTCAVYGTPQQVPISEDCPLLPINPYGETKAIMESLLRHAKTAFGLKSISLRYFNAAGAAFDGSLGEAHHPETHLIPLALNAASGGTPLRVFGNDFPTKDGTCIRDYVHVEDLAIAHGIALERLLNARPGGVWNLGSGLGYSVMEIIKAVEDVSGRPVVYQLGPPRPGDPPELIADTRRAQESLHWQPRCDLETIIRDAWAWSKAPKYGQS